MEKNKLIIIIYTLLFVFFANKTIAQSCTPPPVGCSNTDFSNSFINSSNPNTLEYDNIVSGFHGTMARQANGKVLVWGENMASNGTSAILTPQELNATNYPGLTGSVLKFGMGSEGYGYSQNIVLTTTGLFVWGLPDMLISSSIKNTGSFGSITVNGNTTGLPLGVTPGDVKMLFTSSRTLVITTCNGNVWVLSSRGDKNGDNTPEDAANSVIWHKVKINASTDLTNVVATRGTLFGLMALTSTGQIYTWGTNCYTGGGAAVASRKYATLMTLPTLPAGVVTKMIGMQEDGLQDFSTTTLPLSYYLLASNGSLYALGNNDHNQLGDFTTTTRTNWVNSKSSASTNFTNVAWISPVEHDRCGITMGPAMNVITTTGSVYAWGVNSSYVLGLPVSSTDASGNGYNAAGLYNPTLNPGGLTATDKISAVETGGHTSIVIKQCTSQFGYVGHRVSGSMANGSSSSALESSYNFTSTAVLNLCGAITKPEVQNLNICPGGTVSLNNALLGGTDLPPNTQVVWYTSSTRASGTQVLNPLVVGAGTYYAFYESTSGGCANPPASDPVTVSIYALDNDGDGTPDICDLDDDNDGILDIDEDCIGYRAQNTSGTWKGGTASTLSVTSTGFTAQTNVSVNNNGQSNFWINQNGGGQQIMRASTASHSLTYSFSPGVPASEIAFYIVDVDPGLAGTPSVEYTFLVNGFPSSSFSSISQDIVGTRMNYNPITGKINLNGMSNDQYILLKGFGSSLVTSITLTSTGTGSGDAMAYSLFGYKNCDTDGDGIPDYLDLDSDNDGCPDALEGSENVTAAMLVTAGGTLDVGIGSSAGKLNLGNTVNANGVPNVVNVGGTADGGNNTVGQGIGSSKNANLKDAVCFTLALTADSFSGISGIAFTTANILANDLLNSSVPVIGSALGQVVISQSGVWPAGITLNTATGAVSVAGTVTNGVYVVNYQACVNGANPALCQTQTVTISICGKLPATGTPDSYTKTGISSLVGFANGWPGNVPNGFIAVESKNKGFVITRVANTAAIASPIEGMLIYDNSANCVKLYYDSAWHCIAKSCN